jgi:hypothetical protein
MVEIRCHLMLTVYNLRPVEADLCMPVCGYVTTLHLKYLTKMSYYLGGCIFFFSLFDRRRMAKAS